MTRTPPPLSNDALLALSAADVTDDRVRLIAQLDRASYLEVNKALTALGGTWNRKAQAHLFTRDPRPGIEQAIATGQMPANLDKLASWWPTPALVAKQVARLACEGDLMAGVRAGAVLEPSAGEGALADAVRALAPAADIIAVETDEDRAKALIGKGYTTFWEPFEEFAARTLDLPYAAVVMNPPFTTPGNRLAWLRHVELAAGLLAPGGRLVAIVPRSVEYRTGHRFDLLRAAAERHGSLDRLPDGAFAEVGTDVATNLLVLDAPDGGGLGLG